MALADFCSFEHSLCGGLNDFTRFTIMFYSLSLKDRGCRSLSACVSALAEGLRCCNGKTRGVFIRVCWCRYRWQDESRPAVKFVRGEDTAWKFEILWGEILFSGKVLMAADVFSSSQSCSQHKLAETWNIPFFDLPCILLHLPSAAAPWLLPTKWFWSCLLLCLFWPTEIEKDSLRRNVGRRTPWKGRHLTSQPMQTVTDSNTFNSKSLLSGETCLC